MSAPRRRHVLTAVLLSVLLAGGAFLLDRLAGDGRGGSGAAAQPPTGEELDPPTLALPDQLWLHEPATWARPAADRRPVLSLAGEFPTWGSGAFTFAGGNGTVLGDFGPLRRFRLGVEDGVEDLDRFAELVTGTLGDDRGWTAGGDIRFQRVPDGTGHDFTIYLATSATAARMCAETGLDVVGVGLPEGGVSCRTPGRVILNLSRWRWSVPQYVDREVPLETYRQMLVNHEVGHELGYPHEACPVAGEPAPVMQQQTLDLAGCEANPWPYLDGRRHTGPPAG